MLQNTNIKLSREELSQVNFHLKMSLCFISVLGIITLVIGYVNSRSGVTITGASISSLAGILILLIYLKEHLGYLAKLRAPVIEKTKPIIQALESTEKALEPIRKELKERSSNTMLDSHSTTSLNFLSLERLLEALEERVDEILNLANSNSESSIKKADILLTQDLQFPKRISDHLIQHEMPPMPSSSWIDSLVFLTNKVTVDIEHQKVTASSIYSIKKYDDE